VRGYGDYEELEQLLKTAEDNLLHAGTRVIQIYIVSLK